MTLYVSGLSACHCNLYTLQRKRNTIFFIQLTRIVTTYMEKEFAANTLARIRNRSADGTVLPVVVRVGMKVRLVVERLT